MNRTTVRSLPPSPLSRQARQAPLSRQAPPLTVEGSVPWEVAGMSNPDMERELIGMVIADCAVPAHFSLDLLALLRTRLEPTDFDDVVCHVAYEAMLQVAEEGVRPDLLLLSDELHRRGSDVTITDLTELAARQEGATTRARFGEYVRRQCELAARRHLALVSARATTRSADRSVSPDALMGEQIAALQEAQRRYQRSAGGISGADDTIANAISEYREKVALWRATPGALRGATTGVHALDDQTRGAHPGDLWIIGARMSMGKTSAALSMALSAARMCAEGHQVGIVSLEMNKVALVHRLTAMISGQSATGIEDGASWIDWEAVEDAEAELACLPIRLIDAAGAVRKTNGSRGRMTIEEIARHARAWHQAERLDALYVDYLELVRPSVTDAKETRDVKLGNITQGLKELASELQTAVILLAQANRETEKRGTHVPTLADIRSTDEAAAIADVVLFPVVWDYYRVRGQELPSDVASLPAGVVDLFIAKQRNRGAGKVRCFFLADRMQLVDYDEKRQCPVDYHGNVIRRVSYQGV